MNECGFSPCCKDLLGEVLDPKTMVLTTIHERSKIMDNKISKDLWNSYIQLLTDVQTIKNAVIYPHWSKVVTKV